MSITRTAPYGTVTDDSGAGTDGTIVNNAWVQGFLNLLDGRWSRTTTTLTSTQNVINPSEADVLVCNNASDLTIRSITAPSSPAKPGKPLYIMAIGAGNVILNHQDTVSTNAIDRLINAITSGATYLKGGSGSALYNYDDVDSRWRLTAHLQGGPVAYTPTFANTTLGNGTVTGHFWQDGLKIQWQAKFTLGSTSAMGSAPTVSLPFTASDANYAATGAVGWVYDNSAAFHYPVHYITSSTSAVAPATWNSTTNPRADLTGLTSTIPFTWATSDIIAVSGFYFTT